MVLSRRQLPGSSGALGVAVRLLRSHESGVLTGRSAWGSQVGGDQERS